MKKITPDTIIAYSYKDSDTVILCTKSVLPLSATYRIATPAEAGLYRRGYTSYKTGEFLDVRKEDSDS